MFGDRGPKTITHPNKEAMFSVDVMYGDSNIVATCGTGRENNLLIWDLKRGEIDRPLLGHGMWS